MRWLVLGLGNPLAGADGFGPAVIARLREAGVPDGVELVDAHTDLLGHLHRFVEADEVVLVDVVLGGAGEVAVVKEEEFSGWDHTSVGAHQVSPLAAIKLFRRLHPEASTRVRLVAHFVREEEFRLSPNDAAILDAADVVRGCVGFPST
jgi:hydrogenase maturation protease